MNTEAIKASLTQRFEHELDGMVDRALALNYQRIIGGHYFSAASSECLELYRDGYMLGCIMCSQALLEAILKFVARRNKLQHKMDVEELIQNLEENKILDQKAIVAAKGAWMHRNDFHHLNEGVSNHDLDVKAKECIEAICTVEDEIFGGRIEKGVIIPNKPLYWDIQQNGTAPVFIRNLDV